MLGSVHWPSTDSPQSIPAIFASGKDLKLGFVEADSASSKCLHALQPSSGSALLEGLTRAMNMIKGDGQDTGEQDVRELRRLHAGGTPTPSVNNFPYVRDKEDVPHEEALADLYGLEDDGCPTIEEVKDELSAMVDAGELCMGWDDEQQAFTYWFPQRHEEVWEEVPVPIPAKPSKKTPRARRKGVRRSLLTVAATIAPLFLGMVAEASLDDHVHHQHNTDPDLASEDVHTTDLDTEPMANATSTYRPTGQTYETNARHASATTTPSETFSPYVGKHRRTISSSLAKPAAGKKSAPKPVSKGTADTAKKATLPSPSPIGAVPTTPAGGARPKHENPVQEVVHNVLSPVESLLK